jgi:hypothetical protein
MAYFQTKNPNLGKFLDGLAMEDIMANESILRPNGIFYGHLVCCTETNLAIWYVVLRQIWQPCTGVALRYDAIR